MKWYPICRCVTVTELHQKIKPKTDLFSKIPTQSLTDLSLQWRVEIEATDLRFYFILAVVAKVYRLERNQYFPEVVYGNGITLKFSLDKMASKCYLSQGYHVTPAHSNTTRGCRFHIGQNHIPVRNNVLLVRSGNRVPKLGQWEQKLVFSIFVVLSCCRKRKALH